MIRMPNKADIGASTELLVSVDLLKHGFEVFRALSGGASFDLIAVLGEKNFRIEVKTHRGNYQKFLTGRANILAVPNEEGKIIYYRLPLQGFWKEVTLVELLMQEEQEKRAEETAKFEVKNEAKI